METQQPRLSRDLLGRWDLEGFENQRVNDRRPNIIDLSEGDQETVHVSASLNSVTQSDDEDKVERDLLYSRGR